MTKKTRRKIDVAPRSVAIASTISGSLYGTCSICPLSWSVRRGRGFPRSASLEVTIFAASLSAALRQSFSREARVQF